METLGARPRDLKVPEEREVRRRLLRTTSLVFVVFLVAGWLGMTQATAYLGGGVVTGLIGTLLLTAYGVVLGALLFRASQREVALIRTLSMFVGEAPIGVLFLDPEGRVTYANRAIERLSGVRLRDVANASAAAFVHPDDRARLAREMERRRSGLAGVYELRLLRADGQTLHTLVSGLPFFDGDRYDGSLAAIIDVTELDAARSDALRYRELSAFALDSVTHDLSNRMQEVVVRAAMASALVPADAPKVRATIVSLTAAAERAATLIREVKQIAVAERESWPKRTVELPALVERAVLTADIPPPHRVQTEIQPEATAVRLQANDLAPLILAKLLEQAAEGAPREASEPLRLEAVVEPGPPRELVFRVRGFARDVSDDDLRLMLAPPREAGGLETPWRLGVKLAFASAVAQAHGWGLRATKNLGGKGATFEVRVPLRDP